MQIHFMNVFAILKYSILQNLKKEKNEIYTVYN